MKKPSFLSAGKKLSPAKKLTFEEIFNNRTPRPLPDEKFTWTEYDILNLMTRSGVDPALAARVLKKYKKAYPDVYAQIEEYNQSRTQGQKDPATATPPPAKNSNAWQKALSDSAKKFKNLIVPKTKYDWAYLTGTIILTAAMVALAFSNPRSPEVRTVENEGGLTETVRVNDSTEIKNIVVWDKYIISAQNRGQIDTLTMILDELAEINPATRGFVLDLRQSGQKFLILPDSASRFHYKDMPWVKAFYNGDRIVLSDSYLKGYESILSTLADRRNAVYMTSQMSKGAQRFVSINGLGLDSKSADIFYTIMHEGYHAQQARAGAIMIRNSFKGKNLLDYWMSDMWIEATAAAYANTCLFGGNDSPALTFDVPTGLGVSKIWDSMSGEYKNISHTVTKDMLNQKWETTVSDTTGMKKFMTTLLSVGVPISHSGEKMDSVMSLAGDKNMENKLISNWICYWINPDILPDSEKGDKRIEQARKDAFAQIQRGRRGSDDDFRDLNQIGALRNLLEIVLRAQRPDLYGEKEAPAVKIARGAARDDR
ncbi:MAG: hypothetical protein FWC51_03115 [Proteobacteria bacterium]|nr:hypothetical protein [Pseudomonadota bacterium]